MNKTNPILKMRNITKTFPGVKALSGVNFQLYAGEIHALMGENGAGKSTLIKVLTGVEKLNSGEIFLEDQAILARTPSHAQELGISTVYQEVNLCTNLSVAENIFIGREPMKPGRIDWNTMEKRAEELLGRLNIRIDVTKTLDNYSVAIQQMVAIARALDVSAKVLILDEPTASLDASEVEKLFTVMRQLKQEGLGIIFVTHFLEQVYEVCDRITVLRNGALVGEYITADLPRVQLVAKMIGKDLAELSSCSKLDAADDAGSKEVYIAAHNMQKQGTIYPFDLDINKGEVLGLAGLLGSGRTEVARIIFGIDKPDDGEMLIQGQKKKVAEPIEAMKAGMAFCPENRKSEGIIANLTIRENIILALQAKMGWSKYISRKKQQEFAEKYIKILSISTPSSEQLVKNLSGGNQQKVILGRWLLTNPELLILDEPTRGIDVGTKAEIQKLILELASDGMAVMFISSELDEMLRCCSRMAVMRDKKKIAELAGNEVQESIVMQTIAGVH
ncbi:MAG: sugar ABC transporter ATP-binding protein [Pelosinus sp.]|nr:sugar ABC transporter ATP-binding protein [Pelosinus sp.]